MRNEMWKRSLSAVLAGTMLASVAATTPVFAVGEEVTVPKDGYELVWSDEFDGTQLDLTKWDYQIGTGAEYGIPGWGNSEKQYYTDKEENIRVENGELIITALADDSNGSGTKCTSARIRTYSDELGALYAPTYGYIEAKMTLPEGQGLWPAFWMLPATDDYTIWAASGEIDIMEARGRLTNEVNGTIHYGEAWPNNKYSGGVHQFGQGEDITGEHVYAVEWNPGEMIWYVDGQEYYRTSNWYAKGEGEADNYTYPAPFDKPFYILLNLAVGGTYDGNLEPGDEDLPAQMTVDYVRVFQKTDGYDDSNVALPEAQKDTESFEQFEAERADETGNLVLDPFFDTANVVADGNTNLDPTNNQWYYLAGDGFNGAADNLTTTVDENGTTWANINVTKGGGYSYAIQMIQHLPLANGYSYEISFDAYTDQADQVMRVKMGGDADNAWASYSNEFQAELTRTPQNYAFTFDMGAQTDPTARLEFCFGLDTGKVSIANVKVRAVQKQDNTDTAKEPLNNGNHIYNGSFDQGTNRLGFWHVENAAVQESQLVMQDGGKAWQIGTQLLQSDVYAMTLNGKGQQLKVEFTNAQGTQVYDTQTITLGGEMAEHTVTLTMPAGNSDLQGAVHLTAIGGEAVVDNLFLERTTNHNVDYSNIKIYPIENSDFSVGTAGRSTYGPGMTMNVVEGALEVPAGPRGSNPWDRMLMYTGLPLQAGGTYELSFKVRVDEAGEGQNVEVKIEDTSYVPTVDETFTLTTQWVEHTYTFESSLATGDLKFLLAMPQVDCNVQFDDVVLRLADADASIVQAPMLVPAQEEANLGDWIRFSVNNQVWLSSIDTVLVNGVAVDDLLWRASEDGTMLEVHPNAFGQVGRYTVKVLAGGYDYTSVDLDVLALPEGVTPPAVPDSKPTPEQPQPSQQPQPSETPQQTQQPQQSQKPGETVPETGDASWMMAWVAVLLTAAGALAVMAYGRKHTH